MRKVMSIAVAGILALSFSRIDAQQASGAYMVPSDAPADIRRAVESRNRTEDQRARDAQRKPAEVMMLAGIGEGDRVIEFASFGHYYTTMLVEAVGPSGHVYMIDMPWTDRFGGEAARAFDAAHDNATYTQVHYNDAQLPSNVDAALNVLFYHDMVRDNVDRTALNRKVFAALKPGGIYLIIDHRAEDGSGWREAETIHRIGAEAIVNEVMSAGFELAQMSRLLANPNDDRSVPARDLGARDISDRALLIFRKPGG